MKVAPRTVPRALAALAGTLCFAAAVSAQAPTPVQPAAPAQSGAKVGTRPIPRPSATSSAPRPANSLSRLDARRPPGVRVARPGAGTGAIGSRATSIQGAAWHADNTPIARAVLRLATSGSLVTSRGAGRGTAGENSPRERMISGPAAPDAKRPVGCTGSAKRYDGSPIGDGDASARCERGNWGGPPMVWTENRW